MDVIIYSCHNPDTGLADLLVIEVPDRQIDCLFNKNNNRKDIQIPYYCLCDENPPVTERFHVMTSLCFHPFCSQWLHAYG